MGSSQRDENSASYKETLEALKYKKDPQEQFDAVHTIFMEHNERIGALAAVQRDLVKLSNELMEQVRGDSQRRIIGLVDLHDQMNEVRKSIRALTVSIVVMVMLLLILFGTVLWAIV